jgi:uncharacterized protein (DUF1778 family)
MSRLTLRLPETLHQQLAKLAEREGVSLNQYIVYALTRQATQAYVVQQVPETEIQEQQQAFDALLQKRPKSSPTEIAAVLAQREIVAPEPELTPEIIQQLQQRIHSAKGA